METIANIRFSSLGDSVIFTILFFLFFLSFIFILFYYFYLYIFFISLSLLFSHFGHDCSVFWSSSTLWAIVSLL